MFKKFFTVALSFALMIGSLNISAMTSGAVSSTNIVRVTNTEELKSALANAKPGDEIVVAKGEYVYSGSSAKGYLFKGEADGTQKNPIIIRSEDPDNPAVISGIKTSSQYAFSVMGDWWEIRNLKITNAQKGIIIDNSNHTKIIGCEVYNIGSEGIHFRDNSSYCIAENCYVHDTGVVSPSYGEGIYIGSAKSTTGYGYDCHYNTVRGCRLGPNVAAEHVDVKEYTIGTVIENCIFNGKGITGENYSNSFVNMKGNDCILRNNIGYRNDCVNVTRAFEQNQVVDGWGQNALVYGNKVYMDTDTASTGKKMYFLNSWNCTVRAWDNFMAYNGDLFSVDAESDKWKYYNCNMLTYGKGDIFTAELKYTLRSNDNETTDVQFVLVAGEDEVISAKKANISFKIDGLGETNKINVTRAYKYIITSNKTVSAGQGKVFLLGAIMSLPNEMLSSVTGIFSLGDSVYCCKVSG